MLGENEVREYWGERADKFNFRAVGFDCKDEKQQDINYQLRKNFIFKHIKHSVNPTLDYGCGVGRYADCFSSYVGVDITFKLLEIAQSRNPLKRFLFLNKPWLDDYAVKECIKTEQIFTATVLQHCDDLLVMKILESFRKLINLNVLFFYEKNNEDKKSHVISRRSLDYVDMANDVGFTIKRVKSHSHTIHGEQHTLSIIKVNP